MDLSSKLGKTQVITAASTPSQQGGWYCEICKCGLKDSINYLDHINGKKHQRALGFSMRVERSTVSQVRLVGQETVTVNGQLSVGSGKKKIQVQNVGHVSSCLPSSLFSSLKLPKGGNVDAAFHV